MFRVRIDPIAGRRWRLRLGVLATSLCLAATASVAVTQSATAAPATQPQPHNTIVPRPSHAAPMASGGPLYSHGGPVQNAPAVYLLFWGFTSDPQGEESYLQSFLNHVGCTSWLKTVNQYGGGYCSIYKGAWADSSIPPTTPTDAQIQSEALAFANYLGLSHSNVNAQLVIATPTGHSTSGFGSSYCAYHGVVGGTSLSYTDLPYMSDAGYSCGWGSVTGSPEDGVSIVEGHELAEAITDPLLNAWYDANGSEIGDICAWTGLADINLNGSYFAMQPLWSNRANACVQSS
ncbi:MAG TPA: hypothetical protein VJ851_17910 [Jatrophihabitans sp.]|nr:hypothetical protein [Jatrophihabitans sp.]